MLLFELNKSLHQISYPTGVSATCLFPGLLCGIKGLSRLDLETTVLQEPATLDSVVSVKGPSTDLHHLQYLVGRPFLVIPLSKPPPWRFLGTRNSAALVAVAALAFSARAFLLFLSAKTSRYFWGLGASPEATLRLSGALSCTCENHWLSFEGIEPSEWCRLGTDGSTIGSLDD